MFFFYNNIDIPVVHLKVHGANFEDLRTLYYLSRTVPHWHRKWSNLNIMQSIPFICWDPNMHIAGILLDTIFVEAQTMKFVLIHTNVSMITYKHI